MASQSNFAMRYGPSSEPTTSANGDKNDSKGSPREDPFLDNSSRQQPGAVHGSDTDSDGGTQRAIQQAEGQRRAQISAQEFRRRVIAARTEIQQQMLAQQAVGGPAEADVQPAGDQGLVQGQAEACRGMSADPRALASMAAAQMMEIQLQLAQRAAVQAARDPDEAAPAPAISNPRHGEREQFRAAYTESLRRARAIGQQVALRQRASQTGAVPEQDPSSQQRAPDDSGEGARHPSVPFLPVSSPRKPNAQQDLLPSGTGQTPVAPQQARPVPQQIPATAEPTAAKRGLAGYMLFANEQRENVRKDNPSATFGQVGKVLGGRWKALSDEQRASYDAKAAADKKRYEHDKQAQNASHLAAITHVPFTAPDLKITQEDDARKAAAWPRHPQSATAAYLDHSSATRISTDTVIARALKAQYPSLELTIVSMWNCQLLSYAAAGHAVAEPVADSDADPATLSWKLYAPPARRLDGGNGALGDQPIFAKYLYRWSGYEFIAYLVDGRDGASSYPQIRNFYILSSEPHVADRLIMAAGKWSDELHEEILIFDQGNWSKSKELYASIRGARWEDVILEEGMKKAVIEDHLSFFRSRDTYTGLKVPWKRGIIYYGPPGNGKTISIKATMNMLYRQTPEIPTLYVRTLASYMGPEYSVRLIFSYARRYAPCYLVFEDLDNIVSDNVRSYFLNEVDGLKNNDGIFMVGSTNHLDRLDPGISKRPSRFDRKYYFPDPNLEQRVAYCHFWQKKLGDSDDVEFPDKLCKAIAEITDKFSFAYMQEAFVASLLAIARKSDSESRPAVSPDGSENEWVGVGADDANDDDGDDLDEYILWVEMKKQIAILREGMEDKS